MITKLPIGWKIMKVKDFADVITGGTPSTTKKEYWENGTIPWLPSGALKNKPINTAHVFITKEGLDSSSAKIMPKKTVVIALTGATTGQTGILELEASANQSVTGILPSNEHYPKYLFYFLQTLRRKILGESYGGAQPHISQGYVKDLEVTLPPIIIQQKIALMLDKVEKLKELRMQADKLTKDYLKAIFLEMFGKPSDYETKWQIKTIKEVCQEIVDCPHSTPQYSKTPTPYSCIRTSELEDGHINWSSMKYLDEAQYKERIRRLTPQEGDVVYGREGTFGDAIIIPKDVTMSLGQRVMLFRPNEKLCTSEFLWSMVRSNFVYNQALSVTSGSTVGHVNVKDILNFKIICPPIKIQEKYSHVVKTFELIRKQQDNNRSNIQSLSNSITQKAFKGELTC